MIRKLLFVLIILAISTGIGKAQSIVKTTELFQSPKSNSSSGYLKIIQDPALDTLVSRYILGNKILSDKNTHLGMDGFRIQIYSSSNRNAREESDKVIADFINKFPDIKPHKLFENPGYFKVRVGDFRSKTEATKLFLEISRVYPDAYIVPDFINFPENN
jgi:hypothetical protein